MRKFGLLLCICCCSNLIASDIDSGAIQWHDWSSEIWQRSTAENKPVVLYLEAVWCHWCHVMDATTFKQQAVIERLNEDYIAVKVDHDARPDLANKYRNYGWPATIIFAPDGRELLKRAGYIDAETFISMLAHFSEYEPVTKSEDQQDGTTYLQLSDSLRNQLIENHQQSFDSQLGSLKINRKFLDADSVEYALVQSVSGNGAERARAQKTLSAAMQLIDPVWGGAYQYSTYGDWQHPHYEKLMLTQARYLRIYSMAYETLRDPVYLDVINSTRDYLNAFLRSTQGAYYVSQDADLIRGQKANEYFKLTNTARRELGTPRVDEHIYADTNGWAIEGLASVAKSTGNKDALADAKTAAAIVLATHRSTSGGFTHSAGEARSIYLSDNLAMGRAFVALYEATGNVDWLLEAEKAIVFIDNKFRYQLAGYASGVATDTPIQPVPNIDENISLGRFAAKVHRYNQSSVASKVVANSLAYLADPKVATSRLTDAGILMVDDDWHNLASKISPIEADN